MLCIQFAAGCFGFGLKQDFVCSDHVQTKMASSFGNASDSSCDEGNNSNICALWLIISNNLFLRYHHSVCFLVPCGNNYLISLMY